MNTMVKTVILVVIVAAVAFYAGTKYQSSMAGNNLSANGRGGQFRQRLGANAQTVRGEIILSDDKSITVKLADGSSKLVIVTSSTPVSKSTAGQMSDLKQGETVMVFGTANSDGSVTAQNVQLNPQSRGNAAR